MEDKRGLISWSKCTAHWRQMFFFLIFAGVSCHETEVLFVIWQKPNRKLAAMAHLVTKLDIKPKADEGSLIDTVQW